MKSHIHVLSFRVGFSSIIIKSSYIPVSFFLVSYFLFVRCLLFWDLPIRPSPQSTDGDGQNGGRITDLTLFLTL